MIYTKQTIDTAIAHRRVVLLHIRRTKNIMLSKMGIDGKILTIYYKRVKLKTASKSESFKDAP